MLHSPRGWHAAVPFAACAFCSSLTKWPSPHTWPPGAVVAAVCHGSAGLVGVADPSSGEPLVRGKKVSCFTDQGEGERGRGSRGRGLAKPGLRGPQELCGPLGLYWLQVLELERVPWLRSFAEGRSAGDCMHLQAHYPGIA